MCIKPICGTNDSRLSTWRHLYVKEGRIETGKSLVPGCECFFRCCALFVKNNLVGKFYKTDFEFEGTLIYLEVDTSKLETEEIINNFEW